MKLTKEQKDELALKLNSPWADVKLICDGYAITLRVERSKALSYRVATYINGEWRGEWFSNEKEFPEQKFLRKAVRALWSPAKRKEAEKMLGKRHVAKDPFWNKTITYFSCDWPSGKAAINHLCKVCESVQVAPESTEDTTELAA
ncbi:hypothetical protein KDM87_14485 [Undibacterium sp. FT147W]|uniref:Uncharacterized protein n=1 Tax=Undibacterium rivi TaxID=2828729 RepID=A0ABS5H4N9_9BURK|nr:hypothetical protein [Undibacterium rivi]MBR7793803.1 hypothetical protein [Undibacterium rivi]